jgi:hypothetical protein
MAAITAALSKVSTKIFSIELQKIIVKSSGNINPYAK